MNFTIDPLSVALLAWVIKKLFDHERVLSVLKNDCPKIAGGKEII